MRDLKIQQGLWTPKINSIKNKKFYLSYFLNDKIQSSIRIVKVLDNVIEEVEIDDHSYFLITQPYTVTYSEYSLLFSQNLLLDKSIVCFLGNYCLNEEDIPSRLSNHILSGALITPYKLDFVQKWNNSFMKVDNKNV